MATRDVRELALEFAPAAMAELARLSIEAESEAVRVAAGREVLDRAYGRAPQAVQLNVDDERNEPQREWGWLDRVKALNVFLARIEQDRALEQERGHIDPALPEPDRN